MGIIIFVAIQLPYYLLRNILIYFWFVLLSDIKFLYYCFLVCLFYPINLSIIRPTSYFKYYTYKMANLQIIC